MIAQANRKITYLKDYKSPDYRIESVDLSFSLFEDFSLVKSRMVIVAMQSTTCPLVLDGKDLELIDIKLDGQELVEADYQVTGTELIFNRTAARFTLEITTKIKPQENTSLEGLYKSSGNFCTQCEAHGFRKITYFLDRPDVMAIYTVTIEADKTRYPVLLSNGNLIDSGELSNNRHWVKWHDPFKKPCYLFALVAGNFECLQDQFTTCSGRNIDLKIFVEKGNINKCQFAMQALKHAMKWDEEMYGREYDLNIFMLVAVSDFNMGAMENKGLNIFNTRYVLANHQTATDMDYESIEVVVGHEYFHNWTGNRITCRDWFQLSLKEGLTVFRDQEFSADMSSRAVKRISDVAIIRNTQFAQDAGPLAHPVRPDSYIEMNNFYTVTVYNKGAEVIRMMRTLLGAAGFRKGMDLYFERHDGHAVTVDDFVQAMEDANGIDLRQFRLWYSQAGTPELTIKTHYDAAQQVYSLTVTQTCPSTPGQPEKQPFHIPLAIGLIDQEGKELPLRLKDEPKAITGTRILHIKKPVETFYFTEIPHKPTPSLLRNFSAPIKLKSDLSTDDLLFLLKHDKDEFNRWDASQSVVLSNLLQLIQQHQAGEKLQYDPTFGTTLQQLFHDKNLDKALLAKILSLPKESYIAEQMTVADADAITAAYEFFSKQLAMQLQNILLETYQGNLSNVPYHYDAQAMARRSLKNICLSYLMLLDDQQMIKTCDSQFTSANNMTDEVGALLCLANKDCEERESALEKFYNKWQHEALVVDKWLAIQATARLPQVLEQVKNLLQHPRFELKNPNKVRALIGAFATGNFKAFHARNGSGYEFLRQQIILIDRLNPQVAARLVEPLTTWRRFDSERQQLMQTQLRIILEQQTVSKDVYELASKALN